MDYCSNKNPCLGAHGPPCSKKKPCHTFVVFFSDSTCLILSPKFAQSTSILFEKYALFLAVARERYPEKKILTLEDVKSKGVVELDGEDEEDGGVYINLDHFPVHAF